jgi:hypothetical protein
LLDYFAQAPEGLPMDNYSIEPFAFLVAMDLGFADRFIEHMPKDNCFIGTVMLY